MLRLNRTDPRRVDSTSRSGGPDALSQGLAPYGTGGASFNNVIVTRRLAAM